MDSFTLSRNWFNFSFENPELINPTHTAILFFAIEHCNRLGGKEKFGFPTQMTMDALGIKKNQTYIKYLNDLINWGFIKMIQKSTNQYSANIISLNYAIPKKGKALDKAFIKHRAKHGEKQTESTGQSTDESKDTVIKQINKETNKQINNKTIYCEFLEKFNIVTGKKIRILGDKVEKQINARIKDGFSIEEIISAAKNCKSDQFHVDNPKYLTPEFITRLDKLQKYLNYEVSKVNNKKILPFNQDLINMDYTQDPKKI